MKDPWFDNIRPVEPKAAMDAARVHSGRMTAETKPWLPRDDRVITVVDCPRRLREALQRG